MIEALYYALRGICPACHRGNFKPNPYVIAERCPECEVRFERWSGSWTISVVMGYGSGAVFAVLVGVYLYFNGGLTGAENIIIPAAVVFTALFYPLCKNITVGMLYNNGWVYPDPPRLVESDEAASPSAGPPPSG